MVHDSRLSGLLGSPVEIGRRQLLRGGAYAALGLAGWSLLGCGDDDDDSGTATTTEGAGGQGGGGELVTASFVFPFGAPHAGLLAEHYVSQEMGYFAEENIQEELQYKTDLLALIAGGTANYARVTPVNALNAYAQNQPLKMIFQPTYAFVFGVAVPADSEVQEFTADAFRGKSIGITEFAGGEVPMLRALLKRVGLKEGEDVTLLPTSGTTQQPTVRALQNGDIVAFAGSLIDFAGLEAGGVEIRDITPQDVKDVSADDCVGVRADFLEENRDEAVRFCRAYAKGLIFTLENPRAAASIGLPFAPESGTLDEVEEFVNIFTVRRSTPPPDTNFGEMSLESWTYYQELLLSGATGSSDDPLTFDEPIDPALIVDNSLVAEAFDFDQEAIKQQARDYEISE